MRLLTRTRKTLMALGLAASGLALAASGHFDFFHVGNFKRMSHSGDTAGVAAVASLPQAGGTWGVGAIAGLRGEMIQLDGRLLVSPGSDAQGAVRPPEAGEEALLWASARVAQWAEVPLPRDMEQPAFEAFVQEQARARGLSLEQPFAFRVSGQFPTMRWHVVTGEQPAASGGHAAHAGGHGVHANQQTGMKVFHNPGALGQLVGIFSGQALEGVVSHPGERFHVHYADDKASVSGHVDAYAVAEGAVLWLPKP
ncbi:MAG: acetolactate decarboxylase [Hydrogenophaga sp.]|uniref:acetolactate decarboxylase n=1 Tax=Hydrogenophaga sp. TaxID=1904254 RepID=UPI003D0F3729